MLFRSAIVGWPLLIWTDPLCIFNGFFTAWREPLTWVTAATASGFILILLISVAIPNVWCHRLCPLGGLQEWLTQLAKGIRAKRAGAPAPTALSGAARRRTFLSFLVGGAAGLAYRRIPRAVTNDTAFIRPPGAVPEAFNALCARCGNCMKACRYGLIVPDLGTSGIDGLLTPVINFRSGNPDQEKFCFHECTECTRVCPTGALHNLSNEQKQQTAIGVAVVDKKTCIAWEKHEYCVVCSEYCPYHAIIEIDDNGVTCPEVDEAKCRGCGACESQCPALPLAIIVQGKTPQPRLTDRSPQLPPL